MKLKYLFPLFIAMLALMTSCDDEASMTLLDEIQVSSSYVSIPVEGGATIITVTTQDSWTIEKVTTDKNKVEWLTISATSGSAGESQITFEAPSALDGRTAEVLLKSGDKTQRINVIQGVVQISDAKVAEIRSGPDGKTFRATGVVTAISNTLYGNWDLTDETGTIYIYGTLDEKGAERNFLSLGIEVGDEVTIEGPKSTYSGSPQLVNVTVLNINKSLIKVDSVTNEVLPLEGGEFIAFLKSKGQGVSVEIPEDAKSWLSISSIQQSGIDAVVKFQAAANSGGDRSTTITFRTTDGSKGSSVPVTLAQKGAIVKATIAEFLAAEVGNTQYRLSGVITKVDEKYNNNLYLRDFSGETYAYRLDLQGKECKVGDIITIVGKRGYYNAPQVVSGILESVIPVTAATIAEVLTKPDSSQDYYMVTGEITEIENPTYGNLYLKDGNSNIYVYGVIPGLDASGDFKKNFLAAKGIKVGDTLTVIAPKSTHKEKVQLANSIYFSHVSAAQ